MTRAAAILAVAIAAIPAPARADDVQLWTELGATWSPRKKLELSFDQGLRFDEDVSRVNAVLPEVGIHYRPAPWFRTGAAYRFEYERNNAGDMVLRHRLQVDARVRYDLGEVRLTYDLKLQEAIRPSSGDRYRATIRNELGGAYRGMRPWGFGASVELHHDVNQGDTIHLDKVWITAGVSYGKKRKDVDAFYRLELQQNPSNDPLDPTLHIVGMAFHYDL